MPLKVVPNRDRKLHRLVKKAEARTLQRGEALYAVGDPAPTVILVRKGHLRLTTLSEGDGPGRTVALLGPWELGGEEGLVQGTPRRTGAVAGEKTQLMELDGERVARVLRTAARTLDAFLEAKAAEEFLYQILISSRRPGGASLRLGALLLQLARRLGRGEGKGVEIPISPTHRTLADLSGSHRSTITTLLNDWIYEGLLGSRGKGIRILDPETLEKRVGQAW